MPHPAVNNVIPSAFAAGIRRGFLLLCLLTLAGILSARADDGYRLWLRYDSIADAALRTAYASAITELVIPESRPTLNAARDELAAGLRGLLGADVPVVAQPTRDGSLILG